MKFSFKQIRFGLLLSICFALAWSPIAMSQSATVVLVEPPELTLIVGETGNVSVNVQDADDFYGFEIHIHYDPASVQVLDADSSRRGIQVAAGDLFVEDQGFLVLNQADNQNGEILYAFTLLSPAPPISGSGSLIEFELEAIAEGNSKLELEVILASPDGMAIPINLQDGQVTGLAGEMGQPTSSPSTVSSATPTINPATVSPSPPEQIPSPTAIEGTIPFTTPTVSPQPDAPTSTIISPENTPTLSNPSPTEITKTQEPTNTLVVAISSTSNGGTEGPTETKRINLNETVVTEQVEQTENTSRSSVQLLLVACIILVIGVLGGVLYWYLRMPKDI